MPEQPFQPYLWHLQSIDRFLHLKFLKKLHRRLFDLHLYYLDYQFVKGDLNIFTLIYTKINDSIKNYNKADFKNYFENIIDYLNEKDMRIDFTFYVILVSMIKNKKPIIKSIYNEKHSTK